MCVCASMYPEPGCIYDGVRRALSMLILGLSGLFSFFIRTGIYIHTSTRPFLQDIMFSLVDIHATTPVRRGPEHQKNRTGNDSSQ